MENQGVKFLTKIVIEGIAKRMCREKGLPESMFELHIRDAYDEYLDIRRRPDGSILSIEGKEVE